MENKKTVKILLLFFFIKIFFNSIVNYFEFGLGWKFEIHLGWPSKPTHLMGFETEPTAWDLGRAGHALLPCCIYFISLFSFYQQTICHGIVIAF